MDEGIIEYKLNGISLGTAVRNPLLIERDLVMACTLYSADSVTLIFKEA